MHWSDSRGGVDSFLKYVQIRVEDERCASTSASVWLSSCRDSDDCVRLDDKSEPPLIKRTYSAIVRRHGVGAARKCHVVAYSSTSREIDAGLLSVECIACLPEEVPRDWYVSARGARPRARGADKLKAGTSTQPPLRPWHPYETAGHVHVSSSGARRDRAESASSSSEPSSSSGTPLSAGSILPVHASAAPPNAASDHGPIHAECAQRGDSATISGAGSVVHESEGEEEGPGGQSLWTSHSCERRARVSHGWAAEICTPGASSHQAAADRLRDVYDMKPHRAQLRAGPQAPRYGVAAMSACIGIPEAPRYAPQVGYRIPATSDATTFAGTAPYQTESPHYARVSPEYSDYRYWRIRNLDPPSARVNASAYANNSHLYFWTTSETWPKRDYV